MCWHTPGPFHVHAHVMHACLTCLANTTQCADNELAHEAFTHVCVHGSYSFLLLLHAYSIYCAVTPQGIRLRDRSTSCPDVTA